MYSIHCPWLIWAVRLQSRENSSISIIVPSLYTFFGVTIYGDSKTKTKENARIPLKKSHQRFGGYFNEDTRLDGQLDESKQAELKNDVLEEIRLAKAALNEYQEDIAKQSIDYLRVCFNLKIIFNLQRTRK